MSNENGYHSDFETTTLNQQLAKAESGAVSSWLIDGILEEAAATMIFGAPGSAKSLVAQDLALAAVYGRQWLGTYGIEQQPVLYIDEDGNNDLALNARLLDFGLDLEAERSELHFHLHKGFQITSQDCRTAAIEFCKSNGIRLVIMDSLTRLHTLNESSASDMKTVSHAIKQFTLAGISIVMLHHSNKFGRIARGSSEIESAYDCIYRTQQMEDRASFLIENRKARSVSAGGVWQGCIVQIIRDVAGRLQLDGSEQLSVNSTSQVEDKRGKLRERIINHLLDNVDVTETAIAGAIGVPGRDKQLLKEILAELVAAGDIVHSKQGKGHYYRLSDEDDSFDDI